MSTVARTYEGRTFEITAKITPGSPGTYFDPPDADEIDEVEVVEGDALMEWDAFNAILEALLGKEAARREWEAIEHDLIRVAYDDLAAGSDWP